MASIDLERMGERLAEIRSEFNQNPYLQTTHLPFLALMSIYMEEILGQVKIIKRKVKKLANEAEDDDD